MRIFKNLGWFFKEEKYSYIIGVLTLGFIAILNLIPPIVMGDIIDHIANNKLTYDLLFIDVIKLLALAITMYVLRYMWRLYIFGASYRLEKKLRMSLFEHFSKMSSTFYHEHRVGDLMAHATNDLKSIQRVAGGGVLQLADALLTGVSVIFAMIFNVSLKLTLIAIIPMPLMIIGSKVLSNRLHVTFNKAQEAFSEMNNRTHETVSGIKVTKAFNQENDEIERFKDETFDVYKKNLAVTTYDAAFDPLISIVIMLCFIIVFSAGAYFISTGSLSIGKLVAFVNYMHSLVWPMLAFGFLLNTVERGNVSYDRISNLLNIPADIKEVNNPITSNPKGILDVNINSFNYPDGEDIALSNISFNINRGDTLGLVGKTGSGKTTLIKLLLREYDTNDHIYIDGNDIKNYSLSSLHNTIGYVPQDHFLFSNTILNNIRFGNMEASLEQVIEVAKIASVHDDIAGFEEGYETMIGERGVSLSGGQKQRIAIARALLLNPEILILDDALSAVDAKTEESILNNLKTVRNNKTTIIAAHRLSALKHSKLILVFENGNIIERGNHEELIELDGWYNEIYMKQELLGGEDHGI